MTDYSLADDLAVALTLAAEADLIALDRYQSQDLSVQLKPDRTQVTDADQRVERMIRERLAAARPEDAILGEEYGGAKEPVPGRCWIIDPIDGTSNFVRGVPDWGALIALAIDGEPQVGVVSVPTQRRRWWGATGHGAWVSVDGGPATPIRVSQVPDLADASVSYNSLKGWDGDGRLDALVALSRAVERTRGYGDLWSYMLLAEGALDVAGEPDLKPWDIAALVPVIREAGGRATSLDGDEPVFSGSLLATNGILHDEVLGIVARPR